MSKKSESKRGRKEKKNRSSESNEPDECGRGTPFIEGEEREDEEDD